MADSIDDWCEGVFPTMTSSGEMQRWIGHVDVDSFFASVEQRDRPECRGRPVVVGALPGHRGVVATANYQARKFGIHSAMHISEAYRRCQDAVFLRPDLPKYRRISKQIFHILGTITPLVEPVSIDEAYLDLTGLDKLIGTPEAIGGEIRSRIRQATELTVSVGIGPNRLIAKLGSEHHKPDGLTVIPTSEVLDFLAPQRVSILRGLGRQTEKIFTRLGISTVEQLRAIPLPVLEMHLGKNAAAGFNRQAFGIASDQVVPGKRRKSISKETTFEEDVRDNDVLHAVLRDLTADVAATARGEGLAGAVVTLKIRFEGFETHTRQHRRAVPTNDERVILKEAWELFLHGHLPRKPVRLIGVGISGWGEGAPLQADLFEPPRERENSKQLLEMIDGVTKKFGKGMLRIGLTPKTKTRKPP